MPDTTAELAAIVAQYEPIPVDRAAVSRDLAALTQRLAVLEAERLAVVAERLDLVRQLGLGPRRLAKAAGVCPSTAAGLLRDAWKAR